MRRRSFMVAGAGFAVSACNEEARPVTGAVPAEDPGRPIPAGYSERDVPLPLGTSGAPVMLRMAFLRPAGPGPHPVVILHHGSTGRGNDPSRFPQLFFPRPFAEPFMRGGWLVVAPQRRGRGGSQGAYQEGLGQFGYSMEPHIARSGFERAMVDARAATDWVLQRPEVDRDRMLLAGQSRGGILAVGQAGREPAPGLRGVLNFVGGWLGESGDQAGLNHQLFAEAGRANRIPALFLYGEADPFYSIGHSRRNFDAFTAAGGRGTWDRFTVPGGNGHGVMFVPQIWQASVQRFAQEVSVPALG